MPILSSIEKKIEKNCDNWEWLQAILHHIATWDKNIDSLTPADRENFDRLIAYIVFLQNVSDLLPVAQGDLHNYLEDTRGRKPLLEYTLSGLFSANDFTKQINSEKDSSVKFTLIDEILKYDKRMILVSCGHHTLSLFKNKGKISLYNSNNKSGLQYFNVDEKERLVDEIFRA